MHIILHDFNRHLNFAPLSLTRPIGNIRIGMFTNDERYNMYFPNATVGYSTEEYLGVKFKEGKGQDAIHINASYIPNAKLIQMLIDLKEDSAIFQEGEWVAFKGPDFSTINELSNKLEIVDLIQITERWHIYQKNAEVLKQDFQAYTHDKTTVQLSNSNTIIGDVNQIFLEKGAKVEAAILNTQNGPIYVGANAEIMEGSIVRGGLSLSNNAALKLGTKVYGATTLGPHCKVGGEVNNVVFQAYSNKGHDGFLGNAVVGEWCNLGADTNSSNLKNNYGLVKAYNYLTKTIENTGTQFMGVIMGDHSKCGINTMFNTATVIGVSSNIYGGDFPPKYIPSFSWGGSDGFVSFKLEKAFEVAENMMSRRSIELTNEDKSILSFIADNYGQK